MYYSRLCKFLVDQDITVVSCTIFMFDSVREWNRANLPVYVEVYIKTSVEKLRERDQKELYNGLQKGAAYNVMGFDIQMEEPKTPDIVIENNGALTISECAEIILKGDSYDEFFN